MQTKTLKLRIKDKHRTELDRQARQVNFVWNYINELSSRSIRERGVFLSAYDIHPYTKGAAKELGLHSQTLQCIASEYVTRRKQFKKRQLNWRKSGGTRRSLGWIPVNTAAATFKNGQVFFNGQYYGVWDSYGLSQYRFRTASFSEDARGRWYFNVVVTIQAKQSNGTTLVGIDLGCKDAATASNGTQLTNGEYHKLQQQLGVAQRARKKHRVKAIHAKIANRRKDNIHKFTRNLVNISGAIFVGNVKPLAMVKTNMAKSVLDAGWGSIKTILEYKCAHAGIVFAEINEAFSTQTCSCCGVIPDSSPKGRAGLGIRQWTCSECGAEHHRDINAALNIAAAGHRRLAEGIPLL
jgi:IS605 OrfB family transposase